MSILLFKWLFLSVLAVVNPNLAMPEPNAVNHPFFISVTEINHNSGDKNLEISCKIFTDDFEAALSKSTGVKIDLFNPKDKQALEKHIGAYFKKHLLIKLENKSVVLEFVGFERENEAVWSYLQVSNISAPKKMDILNDLLYESFEQQINLVHVSVGNNRKSAKLNYPDRQLAFLF